MDWLESHRVDWRFLVGFLLEKALSRINAWTLWLVRIQLFHFSKIFWETLTMSSHPSARNNWAYKQLYVFLVGIREHLKNNVSDDMT